MKEKKIREELELKDSYEREIDYMRISITDRCNLRCTYCMPDGIDWIPMEEILTFEEIQTVCEEAAKLGIRNIKLTGGEPLVRKGCADLVKMIKSVPQIAKVTLTTNGVELSKYVEELKRAKIDGINVSLDTLDRECFRKITGFDRMEDVLTGLEKAYDLGIPTKINTVLKPDLNAAAWKDMVEIAKEKAIAVRFIEMMPIGNGSGIASISNEEVRGNLERLYGTLEPDLNRHGNGPAVYYKIPGFCGSVGFISAIHGKFCENCNRIRMTAAGEIKPCLCYSECLSVKEALRANGERTTVRKILEQAILRKPKAHCFEEEQGITERKKMAQIGG